MIVNQSKRLIWEDSYTTNQSYFCLKTITYFFERDVSVLNKESENGKIEYWNDIVIWN